MKQALVAGSAIVLSLSVFASAPSTVSLPKPQQDFFSSVAQLCGKAFAGKVSVDNAGSTFSEQPLVMHVRRCGDLRIEIPFHVGENASRTWVISKTGGGLMLKHDHRHQDGSEDRVTQYGGHTTEAGWAQVQSFPADPFTQDLFVREGLPQSIGNTWQMYVYPETFTYRLVRQGREFRVDFDLTQPIAPPAAPWGHEDE